MRCLARLQSKHLTHHKDLVVPATVLTACSCGNMVADVTGAFFGELEFLGLSDERSNDIKAKMYCELSSLHPKDVEDIIRGSPQLQERLRKYVQLKTKLAELA